MAHFAKLDDTNTVLEMLVVQELLLFVMLIHTTRLQQQPAHQQLP